MIQDLLLKVGALGNGVFYAFLIIFVSVSVLAMFVGSSDGGKGKDKIGGILLNLSIICGICVFFTLISIFVYDQKANETETFYANITSIETVLDEDDGALYTITTTEGEVYTVNENKVSVHYMESFANEDTAIIAKYANPEIKGEDIESIVLYIGREG